MDHETVLETLEIAAAEPGGLDRLMAGDTPTAMAVAGHLAGCPSCTLELERLRRVSDAVRAVVGDAASPELRDRTLAYVRAHGIPRGAAAAPGATTLAAPAPAAAPDPIPIDRSGVPTIASSRGSRRSAFGWIAAVAAAVVLSVVATSVLVGARVDDRLAAQDQAIEDLAAVTTATLHVTSQPDVARVGLESPSGGSTSGTLVYSPSTTDLVVVATGLTDPGPGKEYRCWVIVDGQRQGVGKMFFGGGLAYWVGPSPAVAGLDGAPTFGVSLVDVPGGPIDADPVLVSGS
jgi:hypothetical protein